MSAGGPEARGVAAPSGRFRVSVEGVGEAAFSACRGLGGRAGLLAVREGGHEGLRLFRDDVRWEPVVLERALGADRGLWEWFRSGEPRDGSIDLLAADGSVAARWTFRRGRAARWSAPELDAAAPSIAIEELELVHEGLSAERSA
jgi:phage tail-like protein